MQSRHAFEPVPRWRSRGALGLALSAALVAETLVVASEAYAAPAPPAQEEPARGVDGLQAPDAASAQTIARLMDERVEVIGERTPTTSTWVLPDGTMTTGMALAPIWVRQPTGDGTAPEDWAPVDLTLVRTPEGTVEPASYPTDLVLSPGGGAPADGRLVSLASGADGQAVAVEWNDPLPVPELDGPRATYRDVQPGVDLVVEVTRTGFEQFYVLTERPVSSAIPELSLEMAAEGVQVVPAEGGGVAFARPSGELVASSSTPTAWDAEADGERVHPITEPFEAPAPAEGLLSSGILPPPTDVPDTPSAATTEAPVPSIDDPAAGSPPADAGQAEDALAADAGASVSLPLPEAVVGEDGSSVVYDLTPGAEFLLDAATDYPVVIDPEVNTGELYASFDTFVQHGYASDQSAAGDLRLGTFDGGRTIARSFLTFDLSALRGSSIHHASLWMWSWHAGSCSPRDWQIWETYPAGTATRINNQPGWVRHWSTSSATAGYGAGCDDAWVSADVTNLLRMWADTWAMNGTMGLKAANEADNAGWKKFNSADVGSGVPHLYVQWSYKPYAHNIGVAPMNFDGGAFTSSTQPRLSATVDDGDGSANLRFEVWRRSDNVRVWEKTLTGIPHGQVGATTVDPNVLKDGVTYRAVVYAVDSYHTSPANWSGDFTIDQSAPLAPTVNSVVYPADGTWHGDATKPGEFTLTMPAADSTLSGFYWGLDAAPTTRINATGSTTLTITPPTTGPHVLQVQSVDRAGNRSGIARYSFNVGRAGLLSPVEGAQVVRNVRVAVAGESGFSHVKFLWRRGPDSTVTSPIPLTALTEADGRPLTSAFTPMVAEGEYVTWDAGLTLGHVPGPVQIAAVVAKDADGRDEYTTAWTTVTVSPDAAYAATTEVGPGSVNLLTGEYALSSTDVDEFGMALGRTTSSRDTRSGFELQPELLSEAMQKMSAVSDWSATAGDVSVVTNRWHTGKNAMRLVSRGTGSDVYATPRTSPVLAKGATYRLSAWVYVPAASGLSPEHADGLRLSAVYTESGKEVRVTSARPRLVDAWQQLTVDVTVPASAAGNGAVRLYNGFAGAGKEVFFDDVSVREIFAPLGPQWSLGTADGGAQTGYSHISQPYTDVAALHLSGGGEVWFTQGGDGRWWPEPGAESLTLTPAGRGQWRLTELDGTVSTFRTGVTSMLHPGDRLTGGQYVLSTNGRFQFIQQTDGNAVVYELLDGRVDGRRTALWDSRTWNHPGAALTMQSDGNMVMHAVNGAVVWSSNTWGNPGARFTLQNDANAVVYRTDDVSLWDTKTWRGPNPAFDNVARLVSTSPPADAGQTRLVYESVNGRLRLARMIAPLQPGVDNWPVNTAACTTPVPAVGCQVTQLLYATATTATADKFGDYAERLVEVRLHSAVAGQAATTSVAAVRYAYDTEGRLREVWDPRISPALKTSYSYDADGRVVGLGVPGELPWAFAYGTGGARSTIGEGDLVDRSSGRLLTVSRDSLIPGTVDQLGEKKNVTTLVYAVPLARGSGGPYDLGPDALATWAQTRGPTDATAVFGPEDVPTVTTATTTSPGPDGYRSATVHYLDASGREVNTATPAGPDAPAAGFIDTAQYDQFGNVVRSLDATNRLLALRQLPTADADLHLLNLNNVDSDTDNSATRAEALSTKTFYSRDGLDVLWTRGPRVLLAIGNDPKDTRVVQDVTRYVYDQDRPDGQAYHLVTTQTDGLLPAGGNPATDGLLDAEVTVNGYAPIDGSSPAGPTSGWKTGQPTVVTFDATGAKLSALVRYDDQGRAVESRGIGSTGKDASTNLAVYYTAGANAQKSECGNNAAYAGLPCMSYAAGAVTGHDSSRMAGQLPVKHVTAYNRYGSVSSVTESATGPVAGATTTVSRTTVTEYDAADRVLSVTLSGSGAGAGAPVAKTVNRYDPATGDVTVIEGHDPAGAVVSTVRKSFDLLGRMTKYEDGSGGWTTSVFDRFGKPTEVSDSTGSTTSFSYDRAKEPRGFVTSVTDSVAGTISASYGPDGQVMSQSLPGGVTLTIGYDANRTPVSRTYARSGDGTLIASSAAVENAAGQMVTHVTPGTSKRYSYDALGRLTGVQDSINGTPVCVARNYGYSVRGNRLSLATAVSGAGGCVDPGDPGAGASTNTYTYDSADRLVEESAVGAGAWVYDPLGRVTTAPVRGSPGVTVQNEYFANDLIAAQTIEGVARQTWSLDAIGRFASYTNSAWAVGGDGQPGWQEAVTKVNHYDSDSDSPAWIAEDESLETEITRYVDGLDGNLAVETGKSGDRVLQLVDLHGDVMARLPIADGETVADWARALVQSADEFGNPTDLKGGSARVSDGQSPGADGRYGWLGGKQRSADALAGVVLMGVRLYDPGTGRFWSRDPSPGGNSTAYDYCSGDPVNCTDLDGQWGIFKALVKKVAKKVAAVAEVVATVVPGPIGVAAGAISAGAYAVTGNKSAALRMSVQAVAAMVPGGGAMVKAGFAAARSGGRIAAKAGQSLAKPFRRAPASCATRPNSFTPETGVLMADGTTQPISGIEVGDLVAARDPLTGEVTAQPVLDVIVGHGDKHLIEVVTAPAPAGALANGQTADDDPRADAWTATAGHPIWVQGEGWTDADDLAVGDLLHGATGELRVVQHLDDHGWLADQTVYNLSVANTHTFVIGDLGDGTVVHNCSSGAGFTKMAREQIRNANMEKNGGVLKCDICGVETPRAKRLRLGERKNMLSSEIDHIIARAKGGWNTIRNGRNVCARCNNIKGAK
ncbi:DNRLRE domain-containing protein [Blastococcus xanthinilyticus]|uniref:Intein/RHS repeat-associated protein n=1 Tax=Blastococcus xanthinilyticus TaxID=1564164 RepID=A0A5S5D3S5_9ACTN|nr:DNRLRE domain-containing protein [Blastococcus xanthinilyticus]TYP90610.1 intein/RHS repeat-associated protein [Blastococcus xanthinilyticus]